MTLVWIVLGVFGVALCLFGLGWINAIRASRVRDSRIDKLIQPAMDAVRENQPFARDRITELAETPATRNRLFARLTEIGRADLFPAADRTAERVAESDLACWLMHPNELGDAPAAMELIQAIAVQENEQRGQMFLFRFRADPTHWASANGWMSGIAGPYWDSVELTSAASGTFSELTPFDQLTVEQHVALLKEALKKKGFVVPS